MMAEALDAIGVACRYSLEPIAQGRAIYGEDSLQALLLALRTCGAELASFTQRGGSVEYRPDGDGTAGPPWEPSTTFGDLFRPPK